MQMRIIVMLIAALMVLNIDGTSGQTNWNQFRGPNGSGIATDGKTFLAISRASCSFASIVPFSPKIKTIDQKHNKNCFGIIIKTSITNH